jgi:nitric oxide reductase large subunit
MNFDVKNTISQGVIPKVHNREAVSAMLCWSVWCKSTNVLMYIPAAVLNLQKDDIQNMLTSALQVFFLLNAT